MSCSKSKAIGWPVSTTSERMPRRGKALASICFFACSEIRTCGLRQRPSFCIFSHSVVRETCRIRAASVTWPPERGDVTQKLSQIRPLTAEEQEAMMRQITAQQAAQPAPAAPRAPEVVAAPALALAGAAEDAAGARREGFDEADPATWGNPSRNDPCPCGSGEKFKHCHGRL